MLRWPMGLPYGGATTYHACGSCCPCSHGPRGGGLQACAVHSLSGQCTRHNVGMRCFECDAPSTCRHHVVPHCMGGTRTVPLCGRCHGKIHGIDLRTSALTKAALQARITRGERAGNIPYGWRLGSGKRLVRDEAEQMTMATIRELSDRGHSQRVLVLAARALGLLGRSGKPLARTQIRRILGSLQKPRHLRQP